MNDPLDVVARKVEVLYDKGVQMHVSAAQHMLECQQRVEKGEYDGTWTQFCQEHFTRLKERRIQELLSVAQSDDPKKALRISGARPVSGCGMFGAAAV